MLEILALTSVVLLALWAEHRRETALWEASPPNAARRAFLQSLKRGDSEVPYLLDPRSLRRTNPHFSEREPHAPHAGS